MKLKVKATEIYKWHSTRHTIKKYWQRFSYVTTINGQSQQIMDFNNFLHCIKMYDRDREIKL